ncbi:MAG: septation regulator SpoVG [Deltaproteobacteria bacterium]|nr:septation regulator SpoVG [Deltaproteobacteria bacterium]MBI3293813.1 septation regulator SpoVG [Deltaproteobacteria bacterium]
MEITEVKVFPVNEDKLKAYVTIIFDNCFVVRDLKIINGNTGLFVAMPSKKRKDGTFRDIAHPLNSEMRSSIEKKILEIYEQELKKVAAATHKNMEALGQKRNYDDE